MTRLVVANGDVSLVRDYCPWCKQRARVIAHRMQPHERSICTGQRIVWESCGGEKDYVEPTTTDLWSEAWGSLKW